MNLPVKKSLSFEDVPGQICEEKLLIVGRVDLSSY
jgi:hypothetical protein